MNKMELGSITAKEGFKNEVFVIDTFNCWRESDLAQSWLKAMGYDVALIRNVKAQKIKGSFKADVQVVILIQIQMQDLQDVQNLQVKLVSNPQGFNQIDKRWLRSYKELWNIPQNIFEILHILQESKLQKFQIQEIVEECFLMNSLLKSRRIFWIFLDKIKF